MKKLVYLLICLNLSVNITFAHDYLEKDYQNYWAEKHNAKTEVILKDKARVDCLTDEYAVEVDFASKWAESIGQSLYYATQTNKQPAVLLIMEHPLKDLKYLKRLTTVAEKCSIKVFTITKQELESSK